MPCLATKHSHDHKPNPFLFLFLFLISTSTSTRAEDDIENVENVEVVYNKKSECGRLRTAIDEHGTRYSILTVNILGRMSDAGDDVQTDAAVQQEVVAEPPKGKMSVEDALQVRRSHPPPCCPYVADDLLI